MYLILDVETTGNNPHDFDLIEWSGAIVNERLEVVDTLTLKLKPDSGNYRINPTAMRYNKIDILKHDLTANTYKDSKNQLLTWLLKYKPSGKGKLIPVGWNLSFDMSFTLAYMMSKDHWDSICHRNVMDVPAIVRALQLRGKLPADLQGLEGTARYMGLKTEGMHEAKFDVELLRQVLRKLIFLI